MENSQNNHPSFGMNIFYPVETESNHPVVPQYSSLNDAIAEDPNASSKLWGYQKPYSQFLKPSTPSQYSAQDVKELFSYFLDNDSPPTNQNQNRKKKSAKAVSKEENTGESKFLNTLVKEVTAVAPVVPIQSLKDTMSQFIPIDFAETQFPKVPKKSTQNSPINQQLISATEQLGAALRLGPSQIAALTNFAQTSAEYVSKIQEKNTQRSRLPLTSSIASSSNAKGSNRPSLRGNLTFAQYSKRLRSPTPLHPDEIVQKDYNALFPRASSNEPNSLGEQCDRDHIIDQLGLPKDRSLTKAEERKIKRHRRLVKNRESAHLSRLRKKAELDDLRIQVQKLLKRNAYLEDKVAFLENQADSFSKPSSSEPSKPSLRTLQPSSSSTPMPKQRSKSHSVLSKGSSSPAISFSLMLLVVALGIFLSKGSQNLPSQNPFFSSFHPFSQQSTQSTISGNNSLLYDYSGRSPSPETPEYASIYTGRTLQQHNSNEFEAPQNYEAPMFDNLFQ